MNTTVLPSPLGPLVATHDANGSLTSLAFNGERPTVAPDPLEEPQHVLAGALSRYFAHHDPNAFDTLELAPSGTAFQQRVWTALRDIPFGQTVSYGELAESIGSPGAARAVGLANARNPIAMIIPCHRVINSKGQPHGYAGGLDRKRWLLDHEASEQAPAPAARGRQALLFAGQKGAPVSSK